MCGGVRQCSKRLLHYAHASTGSVLLVNNQGVHWQQQRAYLGKRFFGMHSQSFQRHAPGLNRLAMYLQALFCCVFSAEGSAMSISVIIEHSTPTGGLGSAARLFVCAIWQRIPCIDSSRRCFVLACLGLVCALPFRIVVFRM